MDPVALPSVTVDVERRWVVRGDSGVRLTAREALLFRSLARNPGTTVPRSVLIATVWPEAARVSVRTVDTLIGRLRRKIEADPKSPACLLTVQGEGYRLVIGAESEVEAGGAVVTVNLTHRWVANGIERRALTEQEANTLAYLHQHRQRVVSRAELLREVWHYKNVGRSRAVDKAMFRLRRKLEFSVANDPILVAVRGVGYQLQPDRLAGLGATPRASVRSHATAPPAPMVFLGRDEDFARATKRIEDRRLVVLRGAPGVGKTTLASALFHAVAEGVRKVWVDLREASTLEEIVRSTALAAGVALTSRDVAGRAAELGEGLASEGPVVVFLDNFEQVVGHAPASIGIWLDQPSCRFLVTSRHALELDAESIVDLAPLRSSDAKTLFIHHAGDRGVTFQDSDAPAIEDIVTRLEGIPLSIELAAARTGVLSCRAMAQKLMAPLWLLESNGAILSAIRWSWDLAGAEEREALTALALLRGPFDAEIARGLWGTTEAQTLVMLETLRGHSLLQRSHAFDGTGFDVLSLVRDYAETQLGGRQRRTIGQRMVQVLGRVCHAWASQVETEGPSVMRWLADASGNLFAAFELTTLEQSDERCRIAFALSTLERVIGPSPELVAVMDRAVADAPPSWRGIMHLRRSRLYWLTGEQDEFESDLERAIQCGEENDDVPLLGRAHAWRAYTRSLANVSERGELEMALALTQRSGDAVAEMQVWASLAFHHRHRGQWQEALACHERQKVLLRTRGLSAFVGGTAALANIVGTHLLQGNLRAARVGAEEVLEAAEASGERGMAASAHVILACVATDLGDHAAAHDHLGRCAAWYGSRTRGMDAGIYHMWGAFLAFDMGDLQEVDGWLAQAERVAARTGSTRLWGGIHSLQEALAHIRGDLTSAIRYGEQALEEESELRNRVPMLLRHVAVLAELGRFADMDRLLDEAREGVRQIEMPMMEHALAAAIAHKSLAREGLDEGSGGVAPGWSERIERQFPLVGSGAPEAVEIRINFQMLRALLERSRTTDLDATAVPDHPVQ